jgi:hypothetical protein
MTMLTLQGSLSAAIHFVLEQFGAPSTWNWTHWRLMIKTCFSDMFWVELIQSGRAW